LRTPLNAVFTESYANTPASEARSVRSDAGSGGGGSAKKFLAVLLIVFGAALLFSGLSYTFSHALTSKFGLQLFSEDGQPTIAIVFIHALIFLGFTYLVLNTIKIC
jgi:hypothetical protein